MADSDWREVSLDTLSETERKHWQEMKDAYKVYQQAKLEFETTFSQRAKDTLPSDKELKFGYNFGKLSIAVGPKRERKAAKGKDTQSLGDWLAAQTQSGHRS